MSTSEMKTYPVNLPGRNYAFILHYCVLEKSANIVHHLFDPRPGDDIRSFATAIVAFLKAAAEGDSMGQMLAIALGAGSEAKTRRISGEFKFNGVEIMVSLMSTVDDICNHYNEACRISSEAYRNSPEYKAREEQQRELKRQHTENFRIAHTGLWYIVKEGIDTPQPEGFTGSLVWKHLYALCKAIEFYGVDYDADDLIRLMDALGYKQNENVGPSENIATLAQHRAYVGGQIINFLVKNRCLHQMVVYAIEKFDLTREKEEQENGNESKR